MARWVVSESRFLAHNRHDGTSSLQRRVGTFKCHVEFEARVIECITGKKDAAEYNMTATIVAVKSLLYSQNLVEIGIGETISHIERFNRLPDHPAYARGDPVWEVLFCLYSQRRCVG
jgi:hypothetical protein